MRTKPSQLLGKGCQPGDGGGRVAEHGVAAALRDELSVLVEPGVDRGEVEGAGVGAGAGAGDETGGGGVVGDRVGDADAPVGDAAVDQLQGGDDLFGGVQHVGGGAAGAREVGAEDEADLDLDAGRAVGGGVDGRGGVEAHVVEEMAVVGLVDAHHPLHHG
ncbi:hypothetical protein [Streptomyces sp. NPDC004788]